MKKITILLSLLSLSHLATASSTVKFGADVWMPVNGVPGEKELPGYQVEVAQTVLSKQGIDIDYHTYPWSRALELTRGGELDCVFGASHGDEPNFVYSQFPLGSSGVEVYTRADDKFVLNGPNSLLTMKLGAITDYSYDTVVDAYIAAHKTDPNKIQLIGSNDALQQNINKLLAGRLDATVEVKMVFDYKLKQMGITPDKLASKGSLTSDHLLYIACNKNSEAIIRLLDAAIPKMQADGSLQKIIDKYGLHKWW